ncbi:hypothetical protein IJG66_01650 [Candidatus Saccharibacteria bacterium]|nr:hypothetical protein [Candidatus Saccharibacteria bacterium]
MVIKKISTIALAAVLAASAIIVPPAFADDEATVTNTTESTTEEKPDVWLQISPVSNRISLVAGQSLEYAFNVENIGSKTFSYHVYAAPYSVENENYDANFSRETSRTQLSRWITFYDGNEGDNFVSTAGFTINPGEKQTIRYMVSVPADIPEGGQYATIFAESDNNGATSGSGIKTVSRVGLVIYGRTAGDTREEAEITEYTLKGFLTSGQITGTTTIKNTGNTDFESTYSLIVKSLFGKDLYEKNQVYDVLPDTERHLSLSWPDTPMFGIFQVTASVAAMNASKEETKLVLVIPMFVIIIMLILLTIMIVWIIILIRMRKGQRSRLIV